jgi:hypothetical protein
MSVTVWEDGSCEFDGGPCGEPGPGGWLSLHEHFSLQMLELHKELVRLANGRRDLLRLLPRD